MSPAFYCMEGKRADSLNADKTGDLASSLCGESSRGVGLVCCMTLDIFVIKGNGPGSNRTRTSFFGEQTQQCKYCYETHGT